VSTCYGESLARAAGDVDTRDVPCDGPVPGSLAWLTAEASWRLVRDGLPGEAASLRRAAYPGDVAAVALPVMEILGLSAGTDAAVAALWHAAVCADVAGVEVCS
jgi:hypothetical protein